MSRRVAALVGGRKRDKLDGKAKGGSSLPRETPPDCGKRGLLADLAGRTCETGHGVSWCEPASALA